MQQLTGCSIFLLSCIGHTELWVMTVNRLHALNIRPDRLRAVRTLHDVAVPGFPVYLLWLAGFSDTSLLRGGGLAEQSR